MSLDILKGMATTLKNIGKKPTTVSYPEEERELPARFRGRHVLHRYDNGLERCVGCYLCAGACPADAIYIEAEENTDGAARLGGRALRQGLRCQSVALHLLRLLPGGVPYRRDHAGADLQARVVPPRRPGLP